MRSANAILPLAMRLGPECGGKGAGAGPKQPAAARRQPMLRPFQVRRCAIHAREGEAVAAGALLQLRGRSWQPGERRLQVCRAAAVAVLQAHAHVALCALSVLGDTCTREAIITLCAARLRDTALLVSMQGLGRSRDVRDLKSFMLSVFTKK